jgi:hypothetical protein
MRLVSKVTINALPSPYRAQLEVGNPLQYGIVKITAVQPAASATLANPCAAADDIIDTVADHGLAAGDYITFPTLTGGTGLTANTIYRVHAAELHARTFQVALASDGITKVLFSTNITAGTVARVAGSSATGIAEFPLDTSTQTKLWMEPAWSAVRGYPRAITLHDSRLWFGGTAYQPATFWGTGLDRYEDFRVSASEDAGKEFTINSEEANIVQWLVAQDGMLVIGTAGSEWSYGQRIGEDIPRLRRISAFGCGAIQARAVSDSMVYVPRSLRKVREMAWNGDRDGFVSPDMSLLAEHLGASAFVQIAIQRAPDNVVWVLTAAGVLLGFIYERTQNVVGWFRHDTDGLIESLACVKGAGEEDEIWLGVKRTIGGATKRFIERFQPDQIRALKDGETAELVYADSAVVQTVAAVTLAESAHADDIIDTATDHGLAVGDYIQFPTLTFGAGGTGLVANTTYRVHADNFAARTFQVALAADGTTKVLWSVANITAGTVKRLTVHGLTHLEGKSVNVLADGVVVTGKTVASGAITLTVPATTVVVGLPYIAYVEPTYLETADPASVTKAFKKRIVRALVEVWKSEGVEISSDAGVTYADLGTGAALFSGLLETYTDGGTERQASVILRQNKPLPMNLLSLVLRFTLGTA